MLMQVFAIRDRQLNAFMQPFFAQTTGAATRSFRDLVNEKGHQLNNHPEDYELWHLATWNDTDASFTTKSSPDNPGAYPRQICLAINVIERDLFDKK